MPKKMYVLQFTSTKFFVTVIIHNPKKTTQTGNPIGSTSPYNLLLLTEGLDWMGWEERRKEEKRGEKRRKEEMRGEEGRS